MFPLAGPAIPQDRQQLKASLTQSLQNLFAFPSGGSQSEPLECTGDFPSLESLRINLTNAAIDLTAPPPKPQPAGHPVAGLMIVQFEVLAQPLRIESAALVLRINAQNVAIDFDHDKRTGHALMVLSSAATGTLDISMGNQDLQTVLLAGAKAAAKAHGVGIDKMNLVLTSRTPRSVAIDLSVTASKLFLKTTLRVQGMLDIDDTLALRLSGLSVNGEGALGGLAGSLIRPKLSAIEGRAFPLAALSLGKVHLRDLNIDITNGLHVSAKFGA